MGFHTEINTMLRLGKNDPTIDQLKVGDIISISKSNIRIYPINCALLLLLEDWTVVGYCSVIESNISEKGMVLRVKILTLFSAEEQTIYTQRFQEAAKITQELN